MDSASSKSDSLSGEEWLDLSKSDYAKVIFSNLYWNSDTGEVGCHFKVTETVNKNPSDYIGLYKVGYDSITQCLALKNVSKLEFENDAKLIQCIFKAEDLPALNGFYQFLYVTHDKEVSGASMPFAVNHSKNKTDSSDDETVDERIEDDFIMIRYGLERKNHLLETEINKFRKENLVLTTKFEALKQEKDIISCELDAIKSKEYCLLSELEKLKEEKAAISDECEAFKIENDKVSLELEEKKREVCELLALKESVVMELITSKNERDASSFELEAVKIKNNALSSELEAIKTEKDALSSELEAVRSKMNAFSSELVAAKSERNNLAALFHLKLFCESDFEAGTLEYIVCHTLAELKDSKLKCQNLSSELEKCKASLAALSSEKEKTEAHLRDQILDKQRSTLDHNTQLMKAQLEEAQKLKIEAESKVNDLMKEVTLMRRYMITNADYKNYCHWLSYQEDRLLTEQLDDANSMIKAMEESKQLVMKEMSELTEKLKKAKDELCKAKCENILLKVHLEDKGAPKPNKIETPSEPAHFQDNIQPKEKTTEQVKEELSKTKCENILLSTHLEHVKLQEDKIRSDITHLKEKIRQQELEIQQKLEEICSLKELTQDWKRKFEEEICYKQLLFLKLKEHIPNLEEDKFETELENLINKVEDQHKELQKQSDEICQLRQSFEECKKNCEKEIAYKQALYIKLKESYPHMEENNFEMEVQNLTDRIEDQYKELQKLKGECERKDAIIEQLNNEMKILKENEAAALEDVKDKTARLMNAAELYKDLYIGKQKLLKKMKKIVRSKSQTTSSGGSEDVSFEDFAEPSPLPLNIEALKVSTTANSDSDTGEHVRTLPLSSQVETLTSRTLTFPEGTLVTAGIETNANMCEAKAAEAIEGRATTLSKDNFEDKFFASITSKSVNASPSKETYSIPCSICGESFIVSSTSNTSILQHYEMEHKMDMCPICGQLFDKSFPPKYLIYHVNEHFKSN